MKILKVGGVIIAAGLLSACSKHIFSSHDRDYIRKSAQTAPLVVPHGVPAIAKKSYYPVPASTRPASTKPVSLVPPTLQ